MKKRIFSFFMLLLSLVLTTNLAAQKVFKADLLKKEKTPLYNGTFVGLELYGAANNLLGGDYLSSEVSVEVNLKHRFFPIVEIGYGKTDAISDQEIHYKTAAPYFRVGMNYNTAYKKKKISHLFVGFRYGYGSFKYDVQGPALEDGIWGGNVPVEYLQEKSTASWLEFLVGVRAEVVKNCLLGWTIRYKSRLDIENNVNTIPWYVPGFGTNGSSTFGITYSFIYKLPY